MRHRSQCLVAAIAMVCGACASPASTGSSTLEASLKQLEGSLKQIDAVTTGNAFISSLDMAEKAARRVEGDRADAERRFFAIDRLAVLQQGRDGDVALGRP